MISSADVFVVLYFSSAEEEMMPGKTDYRAQISSEGRVQYNFPTVLKSICRIQVTYFPFDVQKCGLTFGSWSHSTSDLDFYSEFATGRLGVLSSFCSYTLHLLANVWVSV